jgi:hypothetical protein
LPHAHLAAGVKAALNAKGFAVPVVSVGKISDPAEAEQLLAEGKADLIGMARQLLADPDWPRKLREGRADAIVRCIYCNVCKQLDENFKLVNCFLWPKGAIQAPIDDASRPGPTWPEGCAELRATIENGVIHLAWRRAQGDIVGYDIHRAEDDAKPLIVEAVKSAKFADRQVLGGLSYRYVVIAYDRNGRHGAPSNAVTIAMARPDYSGPADRETSHA